MSAAHAATFTVNSTADAVDATPGNGVCATAGAVCTLRAAIQEANALAGADTINVPANTYTLAIAGTGENAAATGDLDITAPLTITGSGRGTTIINGGAIDRVFDMFSGATTVNISDLTVTNGKPGALAGGIYNSSATTLTLTRVSVTSSVSTGEGAGINNPGTLILNDVDVANNTGGSGGGGIYSTGTITYNGGTLSGNSAGATGGGLRIFGTATFTNVTISGNSSPSDGGGIYNSGTTTLTNSTVSGNTATAGGSGIFIVGGDTLYLNNVTIYGNLTSKGIEKGTGSAAITSFKNTIIAGNAAGNCSIAFTSGGYNLESTTNTCGFTGTGDQNSVTAGNLNINATLANNGGPTQTHALLAGSFALDRIANGTNGCGTTITTDQRGTARPQNVTCDVGAFELVPAPTTTIGDGTTPASRNVGRSTTNRAVDTFTLSVASGTDTLTGLTVTLSGTGGAADIAASGVKIWKDNGTVPNEWDAGDTQIGSSVSMSGTTATFSGLTEGITTSSVQYLITYDIAAAATPANTLLGRVSAATTTNALTNNDTTDNTLTVAAVSGTVYSDEGTTALAGVSVKIVKIGTGGNSDTTDAFGRYAITATIAATNAIIVYIDNDGTYDANTVTLAGGTSISGLNLYAGRVITRCDNACSLTIANMSTALGAYTDAGDLLYSMTGSLTISGTGTAINIPSGHTFAPGAAITVTPAMEVRGTFTAGAFTHTLSGTGTPFVVSGTFTSTSSTIKYTGTTTATNIATTNYNSLQLTPTGATIYSLTGNLTGGNALTGNLIIDANATLDATTVSNYNLTGVNATINASGVYLAKASTITLSGTGTPLTVSGTFTPGTSTVKYTGTTVATNIATTNYNNLQLTPSGATIYSLTGNLTGGNALTGNLIIDANATLDATTVSNYNLTGVNVTINASGVYLAKASTITLSGDWSNSGTFTPATSSVVMNGTAKLITGSTTFNNFTKSVAAADTLTFAAGSTTTINGLATLNGAAGQLLSLRSSSTPTRWNLNLAGTKSISYVDVRDSDASGSAAAQKPVSPTNSADSGNTISWFSNLAIVKQAWEENGSAPLTSPLAAPVGSTLVFLIYVKNTAVGAISDVRINDSLDETGFQYVAGSLIRTNAATPPTDVATDLAIFNATAPGTGTNLSDAVDADMASGQNTGGLADVDKITVGAVAGQANGSLSIAGQTTFAVRFKVRVK